MRSLEDVTVLDLTRVVSGPFCAMTLGDLGARVIKIERPETGDDTRSFGPPFEGGEASYFMAVNRNKYSIVLDLKNAAGLSVLERLIPTADVLIENFRPGTMERLGLGYDAVTTLKPDLIYCSISGFGDTGADRDRPGYDLIVQGEAGIMAVTGEPDGPPTRIGLPVADLVSAMWASQGILAALYERQRTGQGKHVKVAMTEALAALLTFNAGMYFATGESPPRHGNVHPTIAPYQTFETADGWINLGVANDAFWQRLCQVLERPDWLDRDDLRTVPDRVRNRARMIPELAAILRTGTRDAWLAKFDAAGVPAGAIRSVGEVCDHLASNTRGMVADVPHPTAGRSRSIKCPLNADDASDSVPVPPPLLGQHTDHILREILELELTEIEALRSQGAFGSEPK